VRLGGRLVVELASLEADYDRLRVRRRLAESRRVRRQLIASRTQLLKVEERLDARANAQGPTGALAALVGGRP
jgi:hypothetical protein